MEDSRNIIKAIDALTLKAGGKEVDSKNITEAIDNLKAVYDQEAIGIDDTLTQEGLAADAKATGDAITTIINDTKAYTYDKNPGNFLDWIVSTFTKNGQYYIVYATANTEGWISANNGTCVVQKRNSDYYLVAFVNDLTQPLLQAVYVNRYVGNNWIGWTKLPTRAEMDAASNKLTIGTPIDYVRFFGNNDKTYTVLRFNYDNNDSEYIQVLFDTQNRDIRLYKKTADESETLIGTINLT